MIGASPSPQHARVLALAGAGGAGVAFWVARGKLVVEPVYDQCGTVVAWLSCDSVLDLDGRLVAFIEGSEVYACSGKSLGLFVDGFFCQPDGQAVAFTDSPSKGAALPHTASPPFDPTVIAGVIPPAPSRRKSQLGRVTTWSGSSWAAYLDEAAGWQAIKLSRPSSLTA